MNTQHPYRLRPYHNPKGIDESKVPDGWRFRYADEMATPAFDAMIDAKGWNKPWFNPGRLPRITYIVPVES